MEDGRAFAVGGIDVEVGGSVADIEMAVGAGSNGDEVGGTGVAVWERAGSEVTSIAGWTRVGIGEVWQERSRPAR